MSNKNVLTSVRNTRNSNKSNPDTEPEEPVQSRQQSQARPDMAALSQADTAAIQEALANLRKSDEQLKSQKITFEAEVQRIKESYDDSTKNLGNAIKVIENFEARLVAVETQARKIPDLEQRVNALSGEKDQLQIEKDLLAGEIDQLKTDFDQYKIRPEKFLYNRTVVCSNLYMKPEESREDMLEIADRLLKHGFKLVPSPQVIDVMRLPHNPNLVAEGFTPGLKIEFADENTRRAVLSNAKNLANSPFQSASVRRSMPDGERNAIQVMRQTNAALSRQGIYNLPEIMPSGNIRRPRGFRPYRGGAHGGPGGAYGGPTGDGGGNAWFGMRAPGPAAGQQQQQQQQQNDTFPAVVNNYLGNQQRRTPLDVMAIPQPQ